MDAFLSHVMTDDLVKVTESYSSQLAERLSHSTSFKPQNLIGEHSVRDSQYNDTSTVSSAKKTMVADGNTSGEALRFPLLKIPCVITSLMVLNGSHIHTLVG